MSAAKSWRLPRRLALHAIAVPKSQRILARVLVALLATTVFALTVTPWQQNVTGSGRVLAFRPEERPQNIEAPVEGRIAKWYVVEGSKVKKGDAIVDLSDNDPSIMERLGQERTATGARSRRGISGCNRLRTGYGAWRRH